jgi:ABC-type transporter MlaC component
MSRRLSSVAAVIALAALASPAAASSTGQPGGQRTEALIALLKKVKEDKASPLSVSEAANARVFRGIDRFFDHEALCSKAIAPRASKLKPAEISAFRTKFTTLIRLVAYHRSGRFFRDATVALQPERREGDVLSVPATARAPDSGEEVTLEFRWAKRAGVLKLVDMVFDGESLLRNYQHQVTRLIDKGGVPEMLQTLDDRAAALRKNRA